MKTPVPNHITIRIPFLELIVVRGHYQSDTQIKYVTRTGNIISGPKDTLIEIIAEMDAVEESEGFQPMEISDFYAEATGDLLDAINSEDGFEHDEFIAEETRIDARNSALASVLDERRKQDAKWGEQNHDPITWSAILTEECGEFAEAAFHDKFGGHAAAGLRNEAVQVSAVALQIVECLDRLRPDDFKD